HPQDVPAEGLLGHFPQEGGEKGPREGGSRGHPLVGEVAIHDEEEHGAEADGESEGEGADPLRRNLARGEHEDADQREEVEEGGPPEKEAAPAEEEDEVLADLAEEPRPAGEAEDIVQDEAEGGKELAREEEEHGGAEKSGQAPAPDDLAQGLVELALVDGDDLGELVEHDLGSR